MAMVAIVLVLAVARGASASLSSSCRAALPCAVGWGCPVCVMQAWPGARGACGAASFGASLKEVCEVPDSSPPLTAGVFKSTWAASAPTTTTLPSMLRTLPVTRTSDSPANDTCACGATGRAQMVGSLFGLHTVLAAGENQCRATSPNTGTLEVADVEAVFDEALAGMDQRGRKLSPFFDYHVMLWAPNGTLDAFLDVFAMEALAVRKIAWPCFEATDSPLCYSALFHVPGSVVNVEIASNATTRRTGWVRETAPRHLFATGAAPESPFVTPLHDSRAAKDLDAVVDFYETVLEIDPFGFVYLPGGGRVVHFALPTDPTFGHNATVQYVERPAPPGAETTTAWLQDYLVNASRAVMTAPDSLWPVWGDCHASIFNNVDASTSMDAVVKRLQARNATPYHPFVGVENGAAGFGHTALYILDPSGWSVEYHAPLHDVDPTWDVDPGDFDEYCMFHCD